MKQLTTTNNQFTLEETLMEKVFEASGYKLTIVTPKDSEPHFIAREVSDALGYSKSFSLSQYFRDKLIVTKENGLLTIKNVVSELNQRARSLALLPSSSLQEYLLRHATRPKAKELGADAVVGVRFQTSMILSGTAELLVYGTAVKLSKP